MSLELKNIHISAGDQLRPSFSEASKEIVRGLNLILKPGEVQAIMGPNGSGKSTLASALMGHPKYKITAGKIILDGADITNEAPDKRAKRGLFLSMQYPPEIPGVTLTNFLRLATEISSGAKQNPITFYKKLIEEMKKLRINPEFARRYINTGFSGGEKKKAEILQLPMLNPRYAILDEIDSGLDVDALKIVAEGINRFRTPEHGILIITHYNRILEYVVPDQIHIMREGKIIKTGNKTLAKEIEKHGYRELK